MIHRETWRENELTHTERKDDEMEEEFKIVGEEPEYAILVL